MKMRFFRARRSQPSGVRPLRMLADYHGLADTITHSLDLIKEGSPWFFHVRDLISDRPNNVPVGVGNNDTGFNESLFLSGSGDPSDSEDLDMAAAKVTDFPDNAADMPESPAANNISSGDDSDVPEKIMGSVKMSKSHTAGKRKAQTEPLAPKRTAPLPGISAPAPIIPPRKKPKTTTERFADVLRGEEETARREGELKAKKMQIARDVKMAKLQAQVAMKASRNTAKVELMKLKMEHEYRMAAAGLSIQTTSSPGPSFGHPVNAVAGPSSTYSDDFSSYRSQSTPEASFEDIDFDADLYDFSHMTGPEGSSSGY